MLLSGCHVYFSFHFCLVFAMSTYISVPFRFSIHLCWKNKDFKVYIGNKDKIIYFLG